MNFDSNNEIVLELAIASYGRVLGKTGLDHYSNLLSAGTMSSDSILAEFMSNAEAAARYPDGQSMNDTVVLVFNNVLNRAPASVTGLQWWVNRLNNGLSQAELVKEVLDSARGSSGGDKTQLENKISVAKHYLNAVEASPSLTISAPDLSVITESTDSVTRLQTAIDMQAYPSTSTVISAVNIANGNYSFGGVVDITVVFDNSITVSGVDSTLSIKVGEASKIATFASVTDNSITYKYTIEDGYAAADVTIGVVENGITLNTTAIKDSESKYIPVTYSAQTNTLAVVSDTYAPVYEISNIHYDTKTNNLTIYGSGFNSLLEYNESSTLDVKDRIDFTKLIWDIDSDDAFGASATIVTFTQADITLVQVVDDKSINIIISGTSTLETTADFGHASGAAIDSMDILSGFMIDSIGNISTIASINDIVLGIDNYTWGTAGANTIYGNSNNNTITSLDGNDTIYAQAGNDTISGGAGDDTIVGGTGIDTMSGGAGSDVFVFALNDTVALFTSVVGIDRITDLSLNGASEDRIDLDIAVSSVNDSVSGSVSQATFIEDINTLLGAASFSAIIVTVTGGDLNAHTYLAVDYNADNSFDSGDFVVDVTGVTLTSFTTATFI